MNKDVIYEATHKLQSNQIDSSAQVDNKLNWYVCNLIAKNWYLDDTLTIKVKLN